MENGKVIFSAERTVMNRRGQWCLQPYKIRNTKNMTQCVRLLMNGSAPTMLML